jgi:hypothetical protein
VLVGCEESGIVRDAFIALGHEALSCDFQPTDRPGPHYQGDVFDVIDYPWDLGIFHFPCTHSSVSGAKHFEAKKMDGRYYAGQSLFLRGWKAAAHIPKVAFEHPVSVISTLFRKPDQTVQPYMFGHGETKAICLWLRGLPPLIPTDKVDGREAKVHKMAPGPTRARDRARTYQGLADAMAMQWGGYSLTNNDPLAGFNLTSASFEATVTLR